MDQQKISHLKAWHDNQDYLIERAERRKKESDHYKRVISFDFSSLYADIQKVCVVTPDPPKKKRSFIKGINNGE